MQNENPTKAEENPAKHREINNQLAIISPYKSTFAWANIDFITMNEFIITKHVWQVKQSKLLLFSFNQVNRLIYTLNVIFHVVNTLTLCFKLEAADLLGLLQLLRVRG